MDEKLIAELNLLANSGLLSVNTCFQTNRAIATIRAQDEKIEHLNKMRTHCEDCGADYMATGIEAGCPCKLRKIIEEQAKEIEQLKARGNPSEHDPLKVEYPKYNRDGNLEGRIAAFPKVLAKKHNALVDEVRYIKEVATNAASDRGVAAAFDKAFAQIAALEQQLCAHLGVKEAE